MARKRSYITAFSNLLGNCAQPIYALDNAGKIVYCNTACTTWLGADANRLVGLTCQYRTALHENEPADLALALCPPPEAFLGQAVSASVVRRIPDGATETRPISCFPLGTNPQECAGVLVCVDPSGNVPVPTGSTPPPAGDLHRQLRQTLANYDQRCPLNQLLGQSVAMVRVRQQVQLAIDSEARVAIAGPPGSGREYLARSIHYGRSSTAPALAPLACELLDAELLETTVSSLAASSAELEIERPAALLLLEVDQLTADAQATLMGILSIGELHLRTLATAREPLTELAERQRFRHDLAFALSTLVIQIPPLADRPEDTPLLAQWFLERANAVGGRQLSGFSDEALDRLVAYAWPRNGDELAEVVRHACAEASGPRVQSGDLPEVIRFTEDAESLAPLDESTIRLDPFLEEIEQELLQRALSRSAGNRAAAARLLGISRARLLRRLDHFGLP